jgi:pilus assembly protein CpaB
MKRRVIAAIAAILLGAVGGAVMLSYVGGADKRAMAGLQPVSVLVVSKLIPEGTPAEKLAQLVANKTLPAEAVAAGTVSNLGQVSGRVATTDLQPGEQLLASRFVSPQSLDKSGELTIPKGMEQISISLEPQRVLGGNLSPGATVGLFISLPKDGALPARTHLVLHKVLVSKVQGGLTAVPPAGGKAAKSADTPAGSVLVTLVTSAADAEKVIFGAENGNIWLSLEPADAVATGTGIVTAQNVAR